jgi:hypothetical protein
LHFPFTRCLFPFTRCPFPFTRHPFPVHMMAFDFMVNLAGWHYSLEVAVCYV